MGMNLHAIASPAINVVNKSGLATWRKSNGYTTNAAGKQTPQYIDTANYPFQMQALSGKELQHLNNMNITGVLRALYLNGEVQGVARTRDQGGDLFVMNDTSETWLVVQVLETWNGWSKVAICLQR